MCSATVRNMVIPGRAYMIKVMHLSNILKFQPIIVNRMVTYKGLTTVGSLSKSGQFVKARFVTNRWVTVKDNQVIHEDFVEGIYDFKRKV